MITLSQLIIAAENVVAKCEAKYAEELEHEQALKIEAMGEICDHGQKHGSPLGGDYWQDRWLAWQRLEAARMVLECLLAERGLLPTVQPDLPLKQGYEWRERVERRPAGEGTKTRYVIGELVKVEP